MTEQVLALPLRLVRGPCQVFETCICCAGVSVKPTAVDRTQAAVGPVAHGAIMYMPPELLLHGIVSLALDVYSFGVLSE